MFCENCGNELKEQSNFCPNCGAPTAYVNRNMESKEYAVESHIKKNSPPTKVEGYWSVGRLTIGIISIALSFFVLLQSLAVLTVNAYEANGSISGLQGLITALCFLVAGIVGICTRNSLSKSGASMAADIYFVGALVTIGSGATFGDLPIWGTVSLLFSIIFMICAFKLKKGENK